MIMSEWKEYRLGDVGKIVTGKTPKTAITDNYGGNIPFLSPSDNMELKYVPITARHLTEKGLAEVKSCLIPENSVCVSCIGSDMGKSVITVRPIVTNQQINSIIPSSNFDTNFLYYILQNKKREIKFLGRNGTAVPILNKSAFSNLTIFAPELDEQRSIASILSSLDSKIENNRKICANLEAQAQALFKHWFIDFAPFKDGKFVESELGMIPEGWRVGKLGELIEIKYGKDHKKLKEGAIPAYGSAGLMRYVDSSLYKGESILIPRKGTLNNVMLVNEAFWTVDTMFYTIPKYEHLLKYVFLKLSRIDFTKLNVGTSIPSNSTDQLNKMAIVIPPNNVLKTFDKLLNDIFVIKRHKIEESARLVSLRDTLLPKLMSGEIKV